MSGSLEHLASESTQAFRPELRLLLAAAKPILGERDGNVEDLLQNPIDWEYLIKIASWHGLILRLSHFLTNNGANVPEEVSQRMRAYCRTGVQQNLRLSAELLRVSSSMEAEGIEHVAYKGPVLSQHLYGNIGLRESSDLDLIVRPGDRFRAINCLEALGYEDACGLNESQRAAALRHGFEHCLSRQDLVTVDLHWRAVQDYAWHISEEELWKHVVPLEFCGKRILVFSPEFMLVSLCIHAGQHGWAYLKMFADIAQLLSNGREMDWGAITKLALDSHSRRTLFISLKLANDYLFAGVPADVMQAIDSDPNVAEVAATVVARMWQSETDPFEPNIDVGWMMFRTKGERASDRLRFICGVALRPTLADFKAVSLPRWLHWFYFVLRPIRIIVARLKS